MGARSVQICGTGSGVGKSVIVAGLCRILAQDGFKVAPFKAQNMSLNSFVTHEGGEIGRAQAVQAAACRLKPSVDMNPILLKPTSDTGSQVILRGKPAANMSAMAYRDYKDRARATALSSFNRLKKDFEVVVIEGAGSPAEVNLKSHDIVNMKMARAAGAPVILVGDIDKGGVFAWLTGTMELLTKAERKMVKGFIINKFRGDRRLLQSGLDFLEKRTGIKVLGVIPYFNDIKLPEEDSVSLYERPSHARDGSKRTNLIEIAVIKLPHISNFTDFDPLESEPDVKLYYVEDPVELKRSDIIMLPGTKNTLADMAWLKKKGLADFIKMASGNKRTSIIGICGGYQMLGRLIRDSHHLESKSREIAGLGLLPIETIFKKDKVLAQIKAKEIMSGLEVSGYEIHHGRTKTPDSSKAVFRVMERQGKRVSYLDGAISPDGRVWGTYIHGAFDKDAFRRDLLNRFRVKKGRHQLTNSSSTDLDRELDKLARLLRENIQMGRLREIVFGKG